MNGLRLPRREVAVFNTTRVRLLPTHSHHLFSSRVIELSYFPYLLRAESRILPATPTQLRFVCLFLTHLRIMWSSIEAFLCCTCSVLTHFNCMDLPAVPTCPHRIDPMHMHFVPIRLHGPVYPPIHSHTHTHTD